MPSWTHLIRFIAVEDGQIHLGQLVDPTRDVGQDSLHGISIHAFVIEGSIYDGRVTESELEVKQLLSPINPQDCPYTRCIGLNYKNHAKVSQINPLHQSQVQEVKPGPQEAKLPIPAVPALFTKPRTAMANPYPDTIDIPKCAQDGTSDYEAELAVVIGKPARDITAQDAPAYILGYMVANDVSARALQMQSSMPSFSKGLDSSCPVGPVLVSTVVIQNPQELSVKTIYNGMTVQDGHTSDMIFGVYELLAYLSQGTTIEPGTMLLTGTPEGIGYFRSPRLFLHDGDDVRVSIEKIGTIVNKVHYE